MFTLFKRTVNRRTLSSKVFPNPLEWQIKSSQLKDCVMEKIQLSNGLKAVLISDPQTKKASAALSCEIGSYFDGENAGCAHFLEHLLFLGTKKYPSSSEYERFILDNGGSMNGYTANANSLYYFTGLNPSGLEEGLDRFSRFFYQPLFDESCVGRERIAVDEEYKKNIENDGWRALHVSKELARQSHPIATFNTGNLETMKLISREYLIDWFYRHYSSSIMNLVVVGKQSLPELREMVTKSFSPIKDVQNTVKPLAYDSGNIWDSMKGKVTWIEPIKDLKELSLMWEIPFEYMELNTKAASLLSSLIGHEGKDSILSLLKKKGWAEGLSAGRSDLGFKNATFTISVSLTDEGVKKWEDVVKTVIACMEKFALKPFPAHLFEERNAMKKLNYEWQSRSSNLAVIYCEALRNESIESFPLLSMMTQRFDPVMIQNLLESLVLKNCIISIIAKDAPVILDRQEKWMFSKYAVFPFSDTKFPTEVVPVNLPELNKFVPRSDLTLVSHSAQCDVPEHIVKENGINLFFFPDNEFQIPESTFKFVFRSPFIQPGNARSLILSRLYIRFVCEELNEFAYNASAAGLYHDISLDKNNSISISVSGYSKSTILLLESLLRSMASPKLDLEKFNIFKSSLARQYENAKKNSPVQQSYETLFSTLTNDYTKSSELAFTTTTVTFDELVLFSKDWFSKRRIEGFVGGNTTKEEAGQALSLVQNLLPGSICPKDHIKTSKYQPPQSVKPLVCPVQLDVAGNAVVWTCAVGKKTDSNRTGWDFLTKLIQENFYSELRTKQQLGYIVHSGGMQIDKSLLLNAVVQSSSTEPRDILARINAFHVQFLSDMLSEKSNDTQIRLDMIRESSVKKLEKPFDSLSSKIGKPYSLPSDFYNYLAFEEDKDYSVLERRLKLTKEFELSNLHTFAEEVLGEGNMKRNIAVLASNI